MRDFSAFTDFLFSDGGVLEVSKTNPLGTYAGIHTTGLHGGTVLGKWGGHLDAKKLAWSRVTNNNAEIFGMIKAVEKALPLLVDPKVRVLFVCDSDIGLQTVLGSYSYKNTVPDSIWDKLLATRKAIHKHRNWEYLCVAGHQSPAEMAQGFSNTKIDKSGSPRIATIYNGYCDDRCNELKEEWLEQHRGLRHRS